jgi:uncharacterized protein YbjT (DUF2867 family)
MRVAVAGGAGTVGKHVVSALRAGGHEPVVLDRATGVDLVAGTGLYGALAGADAIIDVSNRTALRRKDAVEFFSSVARNLLAAAARTGVQHLVALSIVGIDRVDLGYYEGKRVQERLLLGGEAPVTVLRATQFHEFVGQTLRLVRGPVAVAPQMRVQPIASAEVAAHLVTTVPQPPQGMAPELAGPQEEQLPYLARKLMAAQRSRRFLLTVNVPGKIGRAWRAGALLPTDPGPRGTQTFDEWLAVTHR